MNDIERNLRRRLKKSIRKRTELNNRVLEYQKERQELIKYLKERIIKCNEDKKFWLRKNELEAHDIREAERGTYEEILSKIEKR